jgi:hypothetical protein
MSEVLRIIREPFRLRQPPTMGLDREDSSDMGAVSHDCNGFPGQHELIEKISDVPPKLTPIHF